MANNYFQFKQFKIMQDKAAMKVGVDGVLLGAITDFSISKKILDIGSGTGLISLMAAQKSNAKITALEIESNAYNQTLENIEISPWQNKITAINIDFIEFWKNIDEKFDTIVCNPPFFEKSYKSDKEQRNIARHNENLPFDEIFKGSEKLLTDKGTLNLIFPIEALSKIIIIGNKYKLFPEKIIEIKPNFNKKAKRVVVVFSKEKKEIKKTELIIETDERHVYTEEYINLTKEFYLKM